MADLYKYTGRGTKGKREVLQIKPGQRGTDAKFVVPKSKPSLPPVKPLNTISSKNASSDPRIAI